MKLWVLFDCLEQPTLYLEKVHKQNIVSLLCIKQLRYGFLKLKLLHTKLSYLVLVPEVRNSQPK